jgi:hypothetical protein
LKATQWFASGHAPHRGFFGRQTVAPKSIIAWAKSPARPGGIIASTSRSIPALVSRLSPCSREMTRSTLVSTAAASSPKAIAAMAEAV